MHKANARNCQCTKLTRETAILPVRGAVIHNACPASCCRRVATSGRSCGTNCLTHLDKFAEIAGFFRILYVVPSCRIFRGVFLCRFLRSFEFCHETHFSALCHPPQAHPRFSCPHEDPFWSRRHQRASRQGAQAPGGLGFPSAVSPLISSPPLISSHYPAAARLHRPAEFAAALKGRWIGKGPWLVLSAGRAAAVVGATDTDAQATAAQDVPPRAPPQARLGLIIGKRLAPHAVTRNALKRVIREAFRLRRHALPARDYVVRLHAKVGPGSLTAIKRAARAEADGHFQRALRC